MGIDERRILYAEDEYTNRRLLQMQLEKQGAVCDTATDGMEALAMFQERPYALVILDQFMPGMNGNEVAARLRETSPSIPLIAITSDDSQLPLLRKAGFDRIFLKPLRGTEYITTILDYLRRP